MRRKYSVGQASTTVQAVDTQASDRIKEWDAYASGENTNTEPDVLSSPQLVQNEQKGEKGFLGRLGESLGDRVEDVKGTFGRFFKQSPIETAVQIGGEAVGAVGDVLFEGLRSTAKALTPDLIEDQLGRSGKEFLQTGVGKAGLEALQKGVEKYEGFKQEHPRAAANLEGVLGIVEAVPLVKGASVGAKAVAKLPVTQKIVSAAEKTGNKLAQKKAVKEVAKGKEIYKNVVGTNKKQLNLLEEFRSKNDAELTDYLVEHGVPLKVTKDRTKFATKEVAENFKNETVDFLDDSLQDILSAYKGAKYVDLEDMASVAKRAIDTTPNIPAVDLLAKKGLVDELLKAEVKRYGKVVDVPTANQIKRNFWKLGFDLLSPQKAPAAKQIGSAIARRIEDVVDSDVVRAVNKEMGKALEASTFLTKISGDAVKGGRLGKGMTRIIGTIAGAKLGVIPALLSGEALTMIVSKLGDVSSLSAKAIKKLRKTGVIPSSIKSDDEAKAFLQELLRIREERLKLPEGATRLPERMGDAGRSGIQPQSDFKKAVVPTTAESSLIKEAKKYKSAEEFVNKQPVVYHGSPVPLEKFSDKKGGVFFTDEYADATGFAGTPDNVYEGYLNFKKPLVIDAKGAKWDELNTKYGKSTQEVLSNAQKDGYDGIVFNDIVDNIGDTADFGGASNVYYAYKPESAFVNESQLKDIWKQAQKKD